MDDVSQPLRILNNNVLIESVLGPECSPDFRGSLLTAEKNIFDRTRQQANHEEDDDGQHEEPRECPKETAKQRADHRIITGSLTATDSAKWQAVDRPSGCNAGSSSRHSVRPGSKLGPTWHLV